mmetsp:Transcript_6402/g.7789  ORF Transcript_6402/g.7789 Transcript_6402/m.7789 type:complete len:214 (-) Transcript_6402:146-787(-)
MSYGFRNIKPMTREERRQTKDKVALEKGRLMKRSGQQARMYRENAPGPEGLTCPLTNAAGYLADADRFHSDVSGEELQARQNKYDRNQQIYENKRIMNAEKEEERWQKMENIKAQEEAYWENQRQLGNKAKKNISGVPYDTVTLQYHDGLDGDRLRHSDDLVRYRAALRAKNLVECGDTRSSCDIINGTDLPSHIPPARPHVPQLDLHHSGHP